MLSKFKQLFESNTLVNNHVEAEHLAKLAATALLIELSRADNSVAQKETDAILEIAKKTFGLANTDIDTWFLDASKKADQAISTYEFTELINQYFNQQQKFNLILNMWQVAFADGHIDRYEDHLIRKVSDLIFVSHSDFIRAKHQVGVAM